MGSRYNFTPIQIHVIYAKILFNTLHKFKIKGEISHALNPNNISNFIFIFMLWLSHFFTAFYINLVENYSKIIF
ncbi:hypothetical protein YTPLAS21_05900 [Candidatus Nitrosocosmicus sp.]|nr:hypothetical protein YTPLAS21_05900 [Candidatus Nitrosocosmicus sp.]